MREGGLELEYISKAKLLKLNRDLDRCLKLCFAEIRRKRGSKVEAV